MPSERGAIVSEDVRRVERVSFPGISSRAYEHPVDRGALATLRTVPGFAQVLKALFGFFTERGLRLSALASTIRVSAEQYPELDRLRNECAATLDLPTVPTVYVMRDPTPNAFTIGLEEPFIVLTTGLVEMADAARGCGSRWDTRWAMCFLVTRCTGP